MTSTLQATKNAITLKGSTAIISDYLSEFCDFNDQFHNITVAYCSIVLQNTASIQYYSNEASTHQKTSKVPNNTV